MKAAWANRSKLMKSQSQLNPSDLGPYHLLATSSLTEAQTRVLKHGETFAVFDRYGDAMPGGLGEQGLFHESTRFLSCSILELEGQRPFFLSSTVHEENDRLVAHLTNPDLLDGDQVRVALGTLHLAVEKFLWQAACYQQIRVTNYGHEAVTITIRLRFEADYADIFEVRGQHRPARGQHAASRSIRGSRHPGLPRTRRRRPADLASFLTNADGLDRGRGVLGDDAPRRRRAVDRHRDRLRTATRAAAIAPTGRGPRSSRPPSTAGPRHGSAGLTSVNGQFNVWFNRAVSDLHMLVTALPTGPYPYAGLPWFNTPFGRDGIITALECLWMRPDLARGVLHYLAATQATAVDARAGCRARQDPPRDPHRRDGHAQGNALRQVLRQRRCHASIRLAGRRVLRADRRLDGNRGRSGPISWRHWIGSTSMAISTATGWSSTSGRRRGACLHQGWKDSDDAICHADGSPAEGPIALCEVQGYVFAAWQAGARLAEALGQTQTRRRSRPRPSTCAGNSSDSFWLEDLGTYALALDCRKAAMPGAVVQRRLSVCSRGSPSRTRARRVIQTIFHPDFFSGWGVRTLASGEARYNPLSYHNGSVWPHDNALIAWGLARYGETKAAARLLAGLFEAGQYFELNRMPELFCGFARHAGVGPIPYPVACSPQAWSAASVFLLIQASLGLHIDATRRPRGLPPACFAGVAARASHLRPRGRRRPRRSAPDPA